MKTKQRTLGKKVHIRWMIRRDMPEVLDIEGLCFPHPWTEQDYIQQLRRRNVIGMISELDERVVGTMVYELYANTLGILNFAVFPSLHGKGIGRAMIEKLQNKLSHGRRNQILATVRETNVDAQLFFKALGFHATSVLRNHYLDTDEDAYVFEYRYKERRDVERDG